MKNILVNKSVITVSDEDYDKLNSERIKADFSKDNFAYNALKNRLLEKYTVKNIVFDVFI